MNIVNIVSEYEVMTGQKIKPTVVRFFEQMDIVGKKFTDKGFEDAVQGGPVAADDVFQLWANQVIKGMPVLAEAAADLTKLYYLDGYNAGRAAV